MGYAYLRQKSDCFLSLGLRQLAKSYIRFLVDCGHIFVDLGEGIVGVFIFRNYPSPLLVGSVLVLVVFCAVFWCVVQIFL